MRTAALRALPVTIAALLIATAAAPAAGAASTVPGHCFSYFSFSCGDRSGQDLVLSEADATTANASVTSAPDGSGLAAWETFDGSTYSLKARRIDRTGTTGSLLTLDTSASPFGSPKATTSAAGTATVVYTGCDGGCVKAIRIPSKGAAGSPIVLSPDGTLVSAREVAAATTPSGLTRAAWVELSNGTVMTASLDASGSVGAPLTLSESGPTSRTPVVAANARGSFEFAWNRGSTTYGTWRIEARRVAPGGNIGPIAVIEDASHHLTDPSVAVSNSGTTVLAWQQEANYLAQTQIAHLNFAGVSGPIKTVSPVTVQHYWNSMCCGGYRLMPQAGIDDQGRARIVWTRYNGWDNFIVESVGFDRLGNVSKLETVDDTPYGPSWLRIATTPAGVSTVLMQRIVYGGGAHMAAIRWDARGVRSRPLALTAVNGGRSTEYPVVAIASGSTTSLGIWQKDGDGKIFSARFG